MAHWSTSASTIQISRSPSRRSSRSASFLSLRSPSHHHLATPSPPLSVIEDYWFSDSPLASSDDDHLPFGYVDLTAEPSSPAPVASTMAHRSISSEVLETQPALDEPHNAKRRRLNNGDSKNVMRSGSPVQEIEEVDLRNVDDDRGLFKLLEQQRADAIKSQQEQSNKPIRLSNLQCVVCMENMTNITATHCGKLTSNPLYDGLVKKY